MSLARPSAGLIAVVLALALALPVAHGSTSPTSASDQPPPDQCVNVAYGRAPVALAVVVTYVGVIAFGFAAPMKGDGVFAIVYVVPALCSVDADGGGPAPPLAPLEPVESLRSKVIPLLP